jgi:hypothetical protein
MMYSLENPDEYLSDFINSDWNGFELYGSGSGRQLLSLIYKKKVRRPGYINLYLGFFAFSLVA